MLSIFIPSYNRPMQLHALLESIQEFDLASTIEKVFVAYKGETPELAAGYEKLVANRKFSWVRFAKKSDKGLGFDFLSVASKEEYPYFGTITDDSVFYRPFYLSYDKLREMITDQVNHFTFRLGYNTKVIDYARPELIHELNGEEMSRGYIRFKWREHSNHYGYPCALDNSIYDRKFIFDTILKTCGVDFTYRGFESKVGEYLKNSVPKSYACCLKTSSLVNIPCNQVITDLVCQNGVQYPYSVEELNRKYLDGYTIDLSCINPETVVSVQHEIPFSFIKQC